ncbi:MAG: MOSC domain-containing protein [Steroidobacteraceae bacterium]
MMQRLLATLPQRGRLDWIGLRPARDVPTLVMTAVEAAPGKGLSGDRFRGNAASKRQVTLLQSEHVEVMQKLLGRTIDPGLLRRNLLVSGINLYALRHARFRVGSLLLEGTGICAPCSRMEQALGPGAFNAMRGHGGITARVVEGGELRVGDEVWLEIPAPLGPEEA